MRPVGPLLLIELLEPVDAGLRGLREDMLHRDDLVGVDHSRTRCERLVQTLEDVASGLRRQVELTVESAQRPLLRNDQADLQEQLLEAVPAELVLGVLPLLRVLVGCSVGDVADDVGLEDVGSGEVQAPGVSWPRRCGERCGGSASAPSRERCGRAAWWRGPSDARPASHRVPRRGPSCRGGS